MSEPRDMNPCSIPKPVGRLLSRLPAWPGSLLFVAALNSVLTPRLPDDVREMMAGKQLRLSVADAGISFNFVWIKGGFVAGRDRVEPDLTISASAYDFYLLSRRQEDPDTLFFSRRLVMEGDTELGLMLKNTLDAMELNVFELARDLPARLLLSMIPGYRKSGQ